MANKRVKPDTPEYRRWQAAWIALLACAFCIGVFMFLSRPYLPDAAFFALFVAANLMVFAAILINGVKMTRLREDCERRQRKSKASRAEEKRRRAEERERDKARLAGMEEMDESAMTLKEKLQHRARLSAERANHQGKRFVGRPPAAGTSRPRAFSGAFPNRPAFGPGSNARRLF